MWQCGNVAMWQCGNVAKCTGHDRSVSLVEAQANRITQVIAATFFTQIATMDIRDGLMHQFCMRKLTHEHE